MDEIHESELLLCKTIFLHGMLLQYKGYTTAKLSLKKGEEIGGNRLFSGIFLRLTINLC